MRITVVCDRFPVLSETFIINQVKEIIDAGHEVKVLSFYPGDVLNYEVEDRYNIKNKTYYLCDNYPSEVNSLRKVAYKIRSYMNCSIGKKRILPLKINMMSIYELAINIKSPIESDVFICHFGTTGAILTNLKKFGLIEGKIGVVFHGSDITSRNTFNKFSKEYSDFDKNTDFLFPVNQYFKGILIDLNINKNKIHTVHMGIDVNDFEFRKRKASSDIYKIVTTARLVEKKGIKNAIKSCGLLKKKGVKFEYNIIGDGYLRDELEKEIDALDLRGYVNILGKKSHSEVKNLINNSDVFILPSITAKNGDKEGIPVSLMEAMAVGIPVISTRHSGIPELISEDAGMLVDENDCDGLAKSLEQLYRDPVLAINYSENARKKIEEDFCNSNEIRKMLSIIETSINYREKA